MDKSIPKPMIYLVLLMLLLQLGLGFIPSPKKTSEGSHEVEVMTDFDSTLDKKISLSVDLKSSDESVPSDLSERRPIEDQASNDSTNIDFNTSEELAETKEGSEKEFFVKGGRFSFEKAVEVDSKKDDEVLLTLVDFSAPPEKRWRSRLKENGVNIYERLGSTIYLAKMRSDHIDRIDSFSFIDKVALYQEEYKIDRKLKEDIEKERDGDFSIKAKLRGDVSIEDLIALDSLSKGSIRTFYQGDLNYNHAVIRSDRESISGLIDEPSIISIEKTEAYNLFNDRSAWVVQSYESGDKKEVMWENGLLGQDEVVGIADTGLDYDHAMFRNRTDEVGTPGPTHRKVVLYKEYADGNDTDFSGHGTHVAGTASGDWKAQEEPDRYDGMAPASKIAFFDIGGKGDNLTLPDNINTIFEEQYKNGARIFSNSWGSASSDYTEDSYAVDEFMWKHNDTLLFFASGNSGPELNTVASPASAKNVVSVGNCINGISEDLAESSSKGPTDQGRLAPTIVAPGTDIISADSDGDLSTQNDDFVHLSGTSMATPAAAGITGLVRQYYREGWYPNGFRKVEDGFVPSGSLLKATLINSAWNMKGRHTEGPIPSNGQGWGKIDLDNTLYFEGDSRALSILNQGEKTFTTSGEEHSYDLYVGSDEKLKLTLAWTDYPGDVLQNDLDLKVISSQGTEYSGNMFSDGLSVPSSGSDRNNVSEQVILEKEALEEGKYTIKVNAHIISHGSQEYSLLASGDVSRSRATVSFAEERYNMPPVNQKTEIKIRDIDMNKDPDKREQVDVKISSDTETGGEEFSISETGQDTGIFKENISIDEKEASKDGVLQVRPDDEITVEYFDGSLDKYLYDNSSIDTEGPTLKKLKRPSAAENTLTTGAAKISWITDEDSYGRIEYGRTPQLGKELADDYISSNHSVVLTGLEPNTTYYFKIISVDRTKSQNVKVHDNNGSFYHFRTPDWPVPLGEGYSGYTYSVSTDEESIFDRSYITSGYYYSMSILGPREGPFYGTMMFDTSEMKITSLDAAELKFFPQSSYHPSLSDKEWRFEVLSDQIEDEFPEPSHSKIENAEVSFTIDSIPGAQLKSGFEVQEVIFQEDKLDLLEENMKDGRVAVRMSMSEKSEELNLVSWYSGHSAEERLSLKAPRLLVRSDEKGEIHFDRKSYSVEDHAHIELRDDDLNEDPKFREGHSVWVNSSSDSASVDLKETSVNSSSFTGSVRLSESNGSETNVLEVEDLEGITVEYFDPGEKKNRKNRAFVDGRSPSISGLDWSIGKDLLFKINWTTDEPSYSILNYGGASSLGATVSEYELTRNHSMTVSGLVRDEEYFFEVISIDEAGNVISAKNGSEPFSFKTPGQDIQPSILLIEDGGNADGYKKTLKNSGFEFYFEEKSETATPNSTLELYDIVIWVIGGFSDTLTVDERKVLADYLDQGGHLYMNGEDIGFDIGDTSFYKNYLHADYMNDTSDSFIIDGVEDDPISDGFTDLETKGTYPSEIAPVDSYGSEVFRYGSGKPGGIKSDNGRYKVVYFAFLFFEGPEDDPVKSSLMEEIINWLAPTEVDDEGPVLGDLEVTSQNKTMKVEGRVDDSIALGSEIEQINCFLDIPNSSFSSNHRIDQNYDGEIANFSKEISLDNVSEGFHLVYLRALDSSGNWGEQEKRTFRVNEDLNGSGGEDGTNNSTTSFDIDLKVDDENDGWHFISTYLKTQNEDLESILNDPEDGIEGDYDKVMYYDSRHGSWLTYVPDRPEHFNSLNELNRTKGFWIHMVNDTTLTVRGVEMNSTDIELYRGWNMVGFPSKDEVRASATLPSQVTRIGVYNESKEHNIEYITDLDTVTLKRGRGYWVYNSVKESITWNVDL